MALKAANAQSSAFHDLMSNQNGSTIQDFLNPVHDAVFKFKNIDESDKTELANLLNQYSGDHLFNEFVVKFFIDDMNAYTLKSQVQNISEFPTCSLDSALHVLADIHNATKNELIKAYIVFLTFDVESFISFALSEWAKVQLYDNLFHHFIIDEALVKYLKRNIEVSFVDHGYCLLSFFCQHDETNAAVIPALTKYTNINIEWEQCVDLKAVFAFMINTYEQLNDKGTVSGFDINGSFENAVKLFTLVAPNWDNLSATFTLRTKPLPPAQTSFNLSGGSRVNDSDLVKIFAGKYSLVPYTESRLENPNLDVIADFNAYNQLSQRRKLQVASFLINNRKRFNDVLGEAAQLVINGLQTKLNTSSFNSSMSSFKSFNARDIGFTPSEDGIEKDARSFVSKLSNLFNGGANIKTFDQAIGFIVHQYIPLLRQFQNRCNETYGLANARAMLQRCSTDRVLNVVGVAAVLPSLADDCTTCSQNNYLSGGAKTKIAPKQAEPTPEPTTVDVSDSVFRGGSSSEDIVKAFIDGQKQFNHEYETIYRKLISALNGVSISNVHAQTFSKLYGVCNQFDSIAIKNAKTTSFISGYYGAKNYNRIYTKCVENTIRSIEESGVSAFNEPLAVLKSLKDLMTSTAQKVQELRTKYINAPKNVSEMLIVAVKKVKSPCALTQKDFNSFTEAINRIYNTIRNYTSETSTYNTKQQLEAYLGKVEDRTKVITEHYDLLIQGLRVRFQQFPYSKRDREYAKEAQTTIYNQIRDIMLYLNKTFDTKLAKERIDHLHSVNLSKEQIDRIEKAFLSFRSIRITPDFKEEMEKLNKSLNPLSVGSVFKIVKKLRKLIIKSQYIQFIAQLYKELSIFSDGFNWDEFIDKYTNLVVLSSIRVEPLYNFGNKTMTLEMLAHTLASMFEDRATNGPHRVEVNGKVITNAAYSMLLDFLRQQININTSKGILPLNVVSELFGTHGEHFMFKGDTMTDKMKIINFDQKFKYNATMIDDVIKSEECQPTEFKSLITNEDILHIKDSKGDTLKGIEMHTKAGEFLTVAKKIIDTYQLIDDKPKPFFYTHLPAYMTAFYYTLNDEKFAELLHANFDMVDEWSVSITCGSAELPIAEYSIDSLFANIIAVIDKYWAAKYTGTLPLPLNINMVLRGGNTDDGEKIEGASVFDSLPFHDQTQSSIIPEAVPFYICALHIVQYYINTFGIDKMKMDSTNKLDLVLHINKISALYPIYEIFHKYQASIQSLTPQQLKICLSVFNEYWNQTQGNEASRLSRAIDLIFSELNACFIFTDNMQYELMKSTHSLSKISVDVINDKLQYLVDTMKSRLDESVIEVHEDPAIQSKRLEGLLNRAYNEIKRNPESHRLAVLKSLLGDEDKGGELRDYYAFMETVISPLLICAKSYMYIFSLFNNYGFDADNTYRNANQQFSEVDFEKIYIRWQDIPTTENINNNNSIPGTRYDKCWTIIKDIVSGRRPELKVLFVENPIVLRYNRLMLNEALANMHTTGHFTFPKFWIVLDEHTYPNQPKYTFTVPKHYYLCDSLPLLKQIYPTVQARTIGDYYNHCVTEFIADYDHFIHAFLTYPGLSDKTMRLIAKRAHDAFKIANVPYKNEGFEEIREGDKFEKAQVYSFKQSGHEQQLELFNNAKKLQNIPVKRISYYLPPPALQINAIIPRFTDGFNNVEDLEITTSATNTYIKPGSPEAAKGTVYNNVQLENTGLYVKSMSAAWDEIPICEYTWFDWVVFNIARCNKLNFCLPYRLVQMFQDAPLLGQYLRVPGVFKHDSNNYQKYNRLSSGMYANIITQNIILRSTSNSNKDKTELSSLNPTWIASIVSTLPYMINTLTAMKYTYDPSVQYRNVSVTQLLTQLIDILTSFYDEIGNFTPFIAFMSNSISINTPRVKPHLFAELLALINNEDLTSLEASDFIKLEWANQYFFNYIDNISFPEYKNRDRFEWIKQFAADKVCNGTFKTEFESSIQTLGRLAWAGLIAKSANYAVEFNNTYRELDETIINVIHIMSECDVGIIDRFIQNIVNEYNDQFKAQTGRMTGGSLNIKYGNPGNDVEALFKRLTVGLFSSVKILNSKDIKTYTIQSPSIKNEPDVITYASTKSINTAATTKQNQGNAANTATTTKQKQGNAANTASTASTQKQGNVTNTSATGNTVRKADNNDVSNNPENIVGQAETNNTQNQAVADQPQNQADADQPQDKNNQADENTYENALTKQVKGLKRLFLGRKYNDYKVIFGEFVQNPQKLTLGQLAFYPWRLLDKLKDEYRMKYNYTEFDFDWLPENIKETKKEIWNTLQHFNPITFMQKQKAPNNLNGGYGAGADDDVYGDFDYVPPVEYPDEYDIPSTMKPASPLVANPNGNFVIHPAYNNDDEDTPPVEEFHDVVIPPGHLEPNAENKDYRNVLLKIINNDKISIDLLTGDYIVDLVKHPKAAEDKFIDMLTKLLYMVIIANILFYQKALRYLINDYESNHNSCNLLRGGIILMYIFRLINAILNVKDMNPSDIVYFLMSYILVLPENNTHHLIPFLFVNMQQYVSGETIRKEFDALYAKLQGSVKDVYLYKDVKLLKFFSRHLQNKELSITDDHITTLNNDQCKELGEFVYHMSVNDFQVHNVLSEYNNTMGYKDIYLQITEKDELDLTLLLRAHEDTTNALLFPMYGGAGSFMDRRDVIKQIACSMACQFSNRARYIDPTQNFNSVPIIVTPFSNNTKSLGINDDDIRNITYNNNLYDYTYKFLYNPNLCSLFNKSGIEATRLIQQTLAAKKKFVFNPPSINNEFINIDWRKIRTIMKAGEKYKNLFGSDNIAKVDKSKIDNWFKSVLTYRGEPTKYRAGDVPNIDFNKLPTFTNAEHELVPWGYDLANFDLTAYAYESTGTLCRPQVRNVKIDDNMFLISMGNSFLNRYLVSPQKDIFNATIYRYEDIWCPTMLNMNEIIDCENGISYYNATDQLHHMCRHSIINRYAINSNKEPNKKDIVFNNAFKAISDFKNFEYNPIYTFIQSMLEDNINTVFGADSSLQFNNFGFDIGSAYGVKDLASGKAHMAELPSLTGGYDITDNFTYNMVNINCPFEGIKELEILDQAYNLDSTASTDKTVMPGKLLYSYIFKNGSFGISNTTNNKLMFHLIMNYFHKYNISFNSMFNQLCFPSILFNAAGLRLSVKRINEIVSEFDKLQVPVPTSAEQSEYSGVSYKQRLFNFIRSYLAAFINGNNEAFDLTKDYRYQVNVKGFERVQIESLEKIIHRIKDMTQLLKADNLALAVANQYITPSVSNSFIVELVKYTSINTQNPIHDCEKLQTLFGSGILEAIRHLNVLTTYISVLFMLLKETSYYSHEYDRDMSYFNVDEPEAFSVI